MRTCLILGILALVSTATLGQNTHLDVEGDVKIRGNIDITAKGPYSTSMYIGRLAGDSVSMDTKYFNTIVGIMSGKLMKTGIYNTLFGYKALN